ncbi:hypothetical protein HQN59_05650 [Schlegelella sp. ID0723]|uniref:Surface carbohydrate biosynthesis protein n=1 Tax=Piscinibacter koreensis TaxID=2742824 RepID=A0A7Y6NL75_9BURK|nr:hypothetical protein [Schlegelella koreensis]
MKHLILPVETAARELDAKLLLAVHAVQRGVAVTLGLKALLNLAIDRFPAGVFLPPNFSRSSEKMIAIAGQLGHRVVGWDEEGLVWINEAMYRERRVSRRSLAGLEKVFAWGAQQADALRPALDGLDVDLVLAGHPRADLLRPALRASYAARAEALRAELGDFILVNSNFGWLNHALRYGFTANGERDLAALAARSGFPADYLAHRLALYNRFVEVLPAIARRFPDRQIVIRPHPSESDVDWRRASEGLANVTVRYDSELIPWLLAAGHIIHNGCTTALETAMLDRTPISYRPVISPRHEIPQPALVSVEARTPADLLDLLGDGGLTRRVEAPVATNLAGLVASASGALASERMAAVIDAMLSEPRPPVSRWRRLGGRAAAMQRRMKHRRTSAAGDSSRNPAYYSQKFPPTPVAEIEARTAAFAAALGLPAPRVAEISDRVFRLTPA